MKILINTCYGGYSVSALAISETCKKKGIECYFFKGLERENPITLEEAGQRTSYAVYNVNNPLDYKLSERGDDGKYTEANKRAELISIDFERTDKDLIEVVKMLGKKANNRYSNLKIIEIPDDVEYIVEQYDGNEHIAEKHRTWY